MSSRSSKKENQEEQDTESTIEQVIQAQVVHLSSAAEDQEIQRPGTFTCGRRTGSKLVFPIVYLGKGGVENPVVLGIVMTGLHGKSLIFGYRLEDLDGDLKEELDQLIEFEASLNESIGLQMLLRIFSSIIEKHSFFYQTMFSMHGKMDGINSLKKLEQVLEQQIEQLFEEWDV